MNYLGIGGSAGAKKGATAEEHSAFEAQAFFIRTKGAGNMDSWPDVLTVRGVTSGEKASTSVEVNGSQVSINKLKLYVRRDKPCCYISTDTWSVTEKTVFELCDQNDVWLMCVLSPVEKDGRSTWTLQCRLSEESNAKQAQPRWEMDIEVSLVGKFQDCPCFLSQTAHTTRRICRSLKTPALKAINEDTDKEFLSPDDLEKKEDFAFIPDFSEKFEETYRALGGTGSFSEGETGELTWFNAGLRIGVGVGLGICLGAGLGAGILARSYQMTANSLKKRLPSML